MAYAQQFKDNALEEVEKNVRKKFEGMTGVMQSAMVELVTESIAQYEKSLEAQAEKWRNS